MNKNNKNSKRVQKSEFVKSEPYMIPAEKMKKEVYSPDGDHLGNIEDFIIDTTNKRIAFAILSFGGILGIGDRHYAIPWDMLEFDRKEERYTLDIDEDKLKESEGYDPHKYPYPYYGPWITGVYGYWGYPPYWV